MKNTCFFLLITACTHCTLSYTQTGSENIKTTNRVSFETYIDTSQATKEGVYVKGYIVHIPYENLVSLHRKKVLIRGQVTIVPGVTIDPGGERSQGREKDSKHILHPEIIRLYYAKKVRNR